MKIETNKLKLVDLRVYRKDYGVEVDNQMPKAIVMLNQSDNKYHNVISKNEVYPFMTRVPYSNTTNSGISFGTKVLVHEPSQIEKVGICAIECHNPLIDSIKSNEYIDEKELEDIILNSPLYFKDRIRIIEKRVNEGTKRKKLIKLASKDWKNNCHYMDQVFSIRNQRNKQLIK